MPVDKSPITPDQIKRIHALKSRLAIPDAAYRSMLRDYRVYSSKQLTVTDAAQFIWFLQQNAERLGKWDRPGRKYDHLAGRKGMATPKQLRMIEAMWADVTRATTQAERDASLKSFLARFQVNGMECVEFFHVHKIVAALEMMKGASA